MNEKSSYRITIVGIIFTVLGLLIVFQMARVSIRDWDGRIRDRAAPYKTVQRLVYPARGNIYDRWGNLLAGNKQVYELGVELAYVSNAETIAATLNKMTR